jgi:hypothetical protein
MYGLLSTFLHTGHGSTSNLSQIQYNLYSKSSARLVAKTTLPCIVIRYSQNIYKFLLA